VVFGVSSFDMLPFHWGDDFGYVILLPDHFVLQVAILSGSKRKTAGHYASSSILIHQIFLEKFQRYHLV